MEALSGTMGEEVIQALGADLRGQLLRSGDDRYDAARLHYNALIDRRPALIVQCAGVADVLKAVEYARTHGILTAVRGGGHNVAGRALVDGGMVIDLSPMKGIRVDPEGRTARTEGGITWGELDLETQAFGLATTGGLVTSTGIAGFTLGGGLGWLMRRHGLACDNLLSVDLVTADGRLLTASADSHPDLFWGLRGAGPNFGVATSFEFRLHPVGAVLAGRLVFPIAQARTVLRAYREYLPAAPDSLTAHFGLRTAPDGTPVAGISLCWCGTLEAGEEAVRPLRHCAPLLADLVRPMAYREAQRLTDALYPPGFCHYWKSNFLLEISDDAVETLLAHFAAVSSPSTSVVIESMGGAVGRVGANETAFGHRGAVFNLLITSVWAEAGEADRHRRWTRGLWEAMQRFSTGETYVNYLDEGSSAMAAYGPARYDRLAALKDRYDPTNLFRLNVNVQPTA